MTFPIRTRLTIVYCAAFCVGAVVLEIGAYAALKLAVSSIADRDLQSRLMGVEEFLGEHYPRMSIGKVQREIQAHAALQPELLRVEVEQGPVLAAAPILAGYGPEQAASIFRAWTSGRAEQPLRILAVRRTIKGVDYRLWLATDLTVPFEALEQFAMWLLLSLPFVIGLAAAGGHWMAGKALFPVLAITTAARAIDATDLSRRITVPESRDELQFLAETLNGMLANIEHSFRKTIEFTANASHELRTPLAVIRATAEVSLMRADADPKYPSSDRLALRQILHEAERNTVLLEDLLRLARADSATTSVHLTLVDLTEILRAICQRCQPLAAKRGLFLRLGPLPEPVWVSADAEYLQRLLLILVDNAIKYTLAGGLLEIALDTKVAGMAICFVKDTGIGISATDLPHIFERFFRSDRARSREEGGAGLGLAIAEWIVRVHNGSIDVESVLGSGSTFRITLPRLVPAPDAYSGLAERKTSLIGNRS